MSAACIAMIIISPQKRLNHHQATDITLLQQSHFKCQIYTYLIAYFFMLLHLILRLIERTTLLRIWEGVQIHGQHTRNYVITKWVKKCDMKFWEMHCMFYTFTLFEDSSAPLCCVVLCCVVFYSVLFCSFYLLSSLVFVTIPDLICCLDYFRRIIHGILPQAPITTEKEKEAHPHTTRALKQDGSVLMTRTRESSQSWPIG